MENLVIKPLGKVLKQAGLISDFQIRTTLKIQSKTDRVKFGTILVKRGILKQKTVDFFADQLPKLLQQPRTKPLGYYLQKAALINAKQIEILLKEQKETGVLLGKLVVQKGWLREQTLKFFLQYFGQTEKKTKLLLSFHPKIIKEYHLEAKAASPYSLLKEVFDWTGGHPLLTQEICNIIASHNYFIPVGMEAVSIEKLVKDNVVEHYGTRALERHLKTIQYYLLNNQTCLPRQLLRLYLQILQQGQVKANQNQEEKELIKLGLVIEQENKLKISNRIYQSVFDSDWVKKKLFILKRRLLATSNKHQIFTAIKIPNEPLTQKTSLIILLGLLIISPLLIFFNDLQYEIAIENDSFDFQSLSISTACVKPIPSNESNQEDWRIFLEQEQQKLQEEFPANCQSNLDKLIVLNALQLGKKSRVLEGINNLCQISRTSDSFNQAKLWLNRWYNSVDWGEQTDSYLNSINDCPAAEKLPAKI